MIIWHPIATPRSSSQNSAKADYYAYCIQCFAQNKFFAIRCLAFLFKSGPPDFRPTLFRVQKQSAHYMHAEHWVETNTFRSDESLPRVLHYFLEGLFSEAQSAVFGWNPTTVISICLANYDLRYGLFCTPCICCCLHSMQFGSVLQSLLIWSSALSLLLIHSTVYIASPPVSPV